MPDSSPWRTPGQALPELAAVDSLSDQELQQGAVDLIEIRLALRQALSESTSLDFPEPSAGMLYRDTAMIGPRATSNVEQAVWGLDENAALRSEWIQQRRAWRLYLQRNNGALLEKANALWDEGGNYLSGTREADDAPLSPAMVSALTESLGFSPLDTQGREVPLSLNDQQLNSAWHRFNAKRNQYIEQVYHDLTVGYDPNKLRKSSK